MITPISQRDLAWKDVVMGYIPATSTSPGRQTTIGNDGCAFASMSMSFQNLGINITPDELFLKTRDKGGTDSQGNVIWNVVDTVVPVEFQSRIYVEKPEFNAQLWTPQAAYDKWVKLARIGIYPMLRVHLGVSPKANHWVVGLSKEKAADPWTGDIIDFKDRYGDPKKNISGMAWFYAPPIEAEDENYLPVLANADLLRKTDPKDAARMKSLANSIFELML